MADFKNFSHPYSFDPKYKSSAVYFCMEFAVDQALKIFSGGLGFLAGSHMRSAYDLKQNTIGIGILWKYGYYDQIRQGDQSMDVLFMEKTYSFLEDTGIQFSINVNRHQVFVRVYYLPPDTFGNAPIFLLSTDVPENDFLARTITHRLYDSTIETKIAQYILLGIGGGILLQKLGVEPDVYHINEAHALPIAFHLKEELGDNEKVRQLMTFTTHTPVPAGNEEHDIHLLERMGFFGNIRLDEVREMTGIHGDRFNLTLGALRISRLSNAVSKKHGEVSREMWKGHENTCPIIHITNSQNAKYWSDTQMDAALAADDDEALIARKKEMKKELFDIVVDQTGQLFDPDVLTIVWARRFAGYKRADLITKDYEQFERFVSNLDHPVQLIWAGKPYPTDFNAINTFNFLSQISKKYPNCAVLTGYELGLSKALKRGSDVWLNTPRITREASGTSGMTAAMNGSLNFSTLDGWMVEFAKDGENSFIIPPVDLELSIEKQDTHDLIHMLQILKNQILPAYYDNHDDWMKMVKQSMKDIMPFFDSARMADEYYTKLYFPE